MKGQRHAHASGVSCGLLCGGIDQFRLCHDMIIPHGMSAGRSPFSLLVPKSLIGRFQQSSINPDNQAKTAGQRFLSARSRIVSMIVISLFIMLPVMPFAHGICSEKSLSRMAHSSSKPAAVELRMAARRGLFSSRRCEFFITSTACTVPVVLTKISVPAGAGLRFRALRIFACRFRGPVALPHLAFFPHLRF